jgi:Uma2 family endonuclease
MTLTVKDLEKLQAQSPEYRMELVDGSITVMSPSGYESDEVAARMIGQLFPYVNAKRLGRIAASSAGFILPDSSTRAPDVSFVRAARLRQAPRTFAQLAPDLMIEVKSPSDSIDSLETKIASFLQQGTRVGILVNPEARTVRIFRTDAETVALTDGDVLSIPDLLFDWQVRIEDLWSPVFEEIEEIEE